MAGTEGKALHLKECVLVVRSAEDFELQLGAGQVFLDDGVSSVRFESFLNIVSEMRGPLRMELDCGEIFLDRTVALPSEPRPCGSAVRALLRNNTL